MPATADHPPGRRPAGATPEALQHLRRALAAFHAWRGGIDEPLAQAIAAAPAFVMPHVLQAWLALLGRDPQRVRQAEAPYRRALRLRTRSARERLHLAAIGAALDDDLPGARAQLGRLLVRWPRDLLALQAAHSLDYLLGDLEQLLDRVARVRPAWDRGVRPGRHAVLAMQAFGLAERGAFAAAEREARAALALNPADARAHHVMAHVFEGTGRAREGVHWLNAHAEVWRTSRMVATHCTWHLALFHLALGDDAHALALHDAGIAAVHAGELADLIDASALLWRLALRGTDAGPRWQALADAWAPHLDDGYCSFSDVHAMLAFVGARDDARARRLLHALEAAQRRPTRYGLTTRQLGLPACRALAAFGAGDCVAAIPLLAGLPAGAHRLGGSHAQRDVLHLTLLEAVERIRRPAASPPGVPASRRDIRRPASATAAAPASA